MIHQVKRLSPDTRDWISGDHNVGTLYLVDLVTKIEGATGKKEKILAKSGIRTMQDLVGLDNADIKYSAKSTKGLGVINPRVTVDASRNLINKNALEARDYIDAEIPWVAKYGTEKDKWGVGVWVIHLNKTP